MLRSSFALACSLLLAACTAAPAPVAADAEPRILAQWSGPHGGTDAASTRVIRTRAEWSTLWQQIGREPPQAFDEARVIAVAVFLGQRRTGGFQVGFTGVDRETGGLVVTYRESTPPRDAMVAQMLTSPWAVALLPATRAGIVFRSTRQP